jgi:hypothetical protein
MGCQNGTHGKREDGTSTLVYHHLMGKYNNQPKVGVGKGLEGGGNGALGNDEGVRHFPIICGVKQATEKMKIERAMGPGCQSITSATTN